MRDAVVLTGVVLQAQPISEYDKRVVILSRERGKITSFAHGARRQNSPLLASTNPFVFGTFSLYEGKNAYTLVSVQTADYFEKLSAAQPGVYYGFYFLELASVFAQENLEASGTVDLIYVALRAVLNGKMNLNLIRGVYECRLLFESGFYAPPDEQGTLDQSTWYAMRFCCASSFPKLFSFTLSEKAEKEFTEEVRKRLKHFIEGPLKSLRIIDEFS